jgi:hypothetical protein
LLVLRFLKDKTLPLDAHANVLFMPLPGPRTWLASYVA